MVKYRLRFEFKKEKEVVINRDNYINDILSDVDTIVSDTPVRKPNNGEIIVISGEDYEVKSVKISFVKEGEITYYDFVALLENKNVKKAEDPGEVLGKKKDFKSYEEYIKNCKYVTNFGNDYGYDIL